MPKKEIQKNLPPGQYLTDDFPVLHIGPIPEFKEEDWKFRIFGAVEEPLTLSYQEFMALPRVKCMADFHCVTGWSRLNNEWEGVAFRELMKIIRPKAAARFATVHCEGGYTTNLPLAVLMDDDVLFAFQHDGQPLPPEHGWPVRLIVPKRYAYKSAKWVRGLELMEADRPGFWEARGYHNDADPWREERYG